MRAEVKRILLADDDANDIELALAALRANHLVNEVDVVRDGAEALDYLHRRGAYAGREGGMPAFVMLDLKMPKVDGLEVLKTVKADPQLRTIPIVVLTASKQERDLVQSYAFGVNAYVVKPVDFNAFVEAVKLLGGFWAALNELPPGGSQHE
jgi:CheY-like chemotaxis protein